MTMASWRSSQSLLVCIASLLFDGCGCVVAERRDRNQQRHIHHYLHPTGDEELRRRRLRSDISSEDDRHHWNLKEQNAIYASIPDKDDPLHAHNRHLQEFFSTRHLSRYERLYREQNDLDLHLNWNGTYIFGEEKESARNLQESQSSTAFSGGKFDSYQEVPLSQGYGTHFANVWVGSPTPQRKTVIVDTGSHYTAFPCSGCLNCGGPHHTDPYFDPMKSKTFHILQCGECRDEVICEKGQCKFSQSYTEGSSWEAIQVSDRLYCGGTDILDSVEPNDEKYSIDFMFGCQMSMTGLFITQLADGIMGMSAHSATLPKQIYDNHMIEHNLFALCYRRELGTSKRGVTAGSMTLGGYSSALDTSPVVYAKNMANVGWYTVYVKRIFIRSGGGQSALSHDKKHRTIRVRVDPASLNSGKGVIVDSGTTDTYLNKAVAKEFNKAWKQATGRAYSHAPIRLTPEQLRGLPTILIQCHAFSQRVDPSIDDYGSIPGFTGKLDTKNPNDLLIAIPATSYMDYSPITKQYTSRVYFTESSGGVLGSNAMQGHNVVFDWENGRIGFAESSCAYDKKNVPTPALDEGYSSDCLVGDPVLSQACIDTVDQRLCEHHPTNIALLGTEVWTAIVESAGTDAGLSCVESAKAWSSTNELDEPVTKCLGDGLCEEKRPCQLTCSEADKAARVKQSSSSENSQKGCGDSFWSACDYGCTQSRIVSVAHTDGFCHEVSRVSRPCHIGACARSDPCRVPFLVHAVIGLRGGSTEKWSLASEDLLVTTLAATSAALSQTWLFKEGDVNVLAVLPWYKDDDDGDDGWGWRSTTSTGTPPPSTDELGLKVVLEISIFNPFARVENATAAVEGESADSEGAGGVLYSAFRNITDRFSTREVKTICRADDLYSLAKRALVLKREVLQHDQFVRLLIDELNKENRSIHEQATAAFEMLHKNADFTAQSRLLAAWSIRTELDNEVNFLGPPKPWWFKALAAAHAVAFLVMAFMLLTTAWTIILGCLDSFSEDNAGTSPRWRFYGWSRHRYTAVTVNDDSFIEDAIMGMGSASGNVELTVQSNPLNRFRGTTPKKRRGTLCTQTSCDL